MSILALLVLASTDPAWIVHKPITWNGERAQMTLEYRRVHYGDEAPTLEIEPRMIVLHHTSIDTLKESFAAFDHVKLPAWRKKIAKASPLGVSVHFLVDQDGTVFRLMPDQRMGRHTIGLNWTAIGIENVGGKEKPLTEAQVKANAKLVRWLKGKHRTIEFLIGHREYTAFRGTDLFRELDASYLTVKNDPSNEFMRAVREEVNDLGLLGIPREALARAAELARKNQRKITRAELEQLTLLELSLERNEIFARYGRAFAKPFLQEHFSKQPWYRVDPAFSYSMLTAIDRENVQTIRDFELALTPERLRIMRNAVFARHGRPFKSEDLDAHFRQQPWYKPDPTYTDARLTEQDRIEIALVQEREQELAGVASLDAWKPGMSVSAKALEGATAWSLLKAYQAMVVSLKLDLGDAFCETGWVDDACRPEVRKHKSLDVLSKADRQALAVVEQAIAWAVTAETDFRYAPDCERECEEFASGEEGSCAGMCEGKAKPGVCEERCIERIAGECMKECKRRLPARQKEYAAQKATRQRRIRAGQHRRGGELLDWAHQSMAALGA